MKEKKVIVSLKGISKTYDNDVKVVKNIDLDIYEGEFLTILGASGCGKTTTLRMIAGFEDVSSGDICIDGSSVIGVPPYKRQVNTAFQSYALFPHLSVYDNIAYGLKVKKVSKAEIHERVSHMLSLIRLDGYEKRKPAQQTSFSLCMETQWFSTHSLTLVLASLWISSVGYLEVSPPMPYTKYRPSGVWNRSSS